MAYSILERAFELAKSGNCQTIGDITGHLKRENYTAVEHHLAGQAIRKQLRALIDARLDRKPSISYVQGRCPPVWTPEDDAKLRTAGVSSPARDAIAAELGRSRGSIDARLKVLGLIPKRGSEELRTLRRSSPAKE